MFKKKAIKNKHLFFLLIIYTILHIFFYTNNFINLLFWFSFFIFFYHQDFNFPKKKEIHLTLTISIIFFILYLVSGFIFGFNNSLFNDPLMNTLINLVVIILPIGGIEILRFKLIKSNKDNFKIISLITFIVIISEINFKALALAHNIIFLHYIISIIIPIIAQNILYTYLSLNAHYDIPIIIRIFDKVPKYLLPLILNSNWFIVGAFAIIKVFIIYYLFKYFIFSKKTINYFTNLNMLLYPITIFTSILLVLFMLGLFTYQPIAILSNSMNPIFKKGDVVIYKKCENIVPGDIIVFQYQNQMIVHRVVSIHDYYVTKGDANNSVDFIKIKKEDIKGVYQFHIKYLGYPSIWLNELFTRED